jgi:hypothetical protein
MMGNRSCIASDMFAPNGNDAKCGYACHATVAAKDFHGVSEEVNGEQDCDHHRRL